MSWTAIILSYASMSFLLLFASFIIKSPKLLIIQSFLFLYGVVNALFLGMFPMAISLNNATPSAFNPVTIALFSVNVIMTIAFIWLYGAHLIQNFTSFVQEMTRGRKE